MTTPPPLASLAASVCPPARQHSPGPQPLEPTYFLRLRQAVNASRGYAAREEICSSPHKTMTRAPLEEVSGFLVKMESGRNARGQRRDVHLPPFLNLACQIWTPSYYASQSLNAAAASHRVLNRTDGWEADEERDRRRQARGGGNGLMGGREMWARNTPPLTTTASTNDRSVGPFARGPFSFACHPASSLVRTP